MPFTLAHPAVVLPLRRLYPGAFLPLVLGSVGPDLKFFLPFRLEHALGETHSLLGALTLGPLLALALLAVVVLLEPVLLQPLWGTHRALLRQALFPWRRSLGPWVWALPALWLGSFSHYVCDAATHPQGSIVRMLPVLDVSLPILGHAVTTYRLLQYLSSLAGLIILLWWYYRDLNAVPRTEQEEATSGQAVWLAFIALGAVALAIRAVLRTLPYHPGPGGLLYATTTHFISDFAALYVLWGLMNWIRWPRRG